MRWIASLFLLLAVAAPAHADERRFMLSGFDRVRIEGPFEVEIVAGRSAGATAIGEPRALDGVNVRLAGSTLVITPSVNAWGGDPRSPRSVPKIAVTAVNLRAVHVVGGARVSVDRLSGQRVDVGLMGAGSLDVYAVEGDRFTAAVAGTGRLRLAGRVLAATIDSTGAAEIEAADLSAGTLTVTSQSAGDSHFRARNAARITAQGGGTVTVTGAAKCNVSGSGRVLCGAESEARP